MSCPTTNTTHTVTGITSSSSGTVTNTSEVASGATLACSLTTPYNWNASVNPGQGATRSKVSASVTSGGGSVSVSRTNGSTAHTITYTPPVVTSQSSAVVKIEHRKQNSYYDGDAGSYQWPFGNIGTLTTVNITVTVCPVAATTVSITSVDDITPDENSTDVVTATPSMATGRTVSSYAWTTTNSSVISLSSTTIESPMLTFGNITTNTSATIGVTITDNTGATATASQAYTVQFMNQGPTASLTGSGAVAVNTAATMDGSTSYDIDGQSLTYAFSATNEGESFTSGGASSTSSWSFTPTEVGTYTVTLTVSDGTLTNTATKTVLSTNSEGETTTGAGGYGFEVYNAAGSALIRGDELLVRKAVVLDANSLGAVNATLSGTETATKVLAVTAGEGNTGAQITVTTGTTSGSLNLAILNALAGAQIYIYIMR